MPKIIIHNVETNELIERDMNEQELAQFELDEYKNELEVQKLIEKNEQKRALLDKLGITEEEAKLLLS